MPGALQEFLDTGGDLAAVRVVQADLVASYRHDIKKYAGSRALNVEDIFDQLPLQLDRGIVLSRLNVEVAGKVLYLPWYALFCLDEVMVPVKPLPKVTLPKI